MLHWEDQLEQDLHDVVSRSISNTLPVSLDARDSFPFASCSSILVTPSSFLNWVRASFCVWGPLSVCLPPTEARLVIALSSLHIEAWYLLQLLDLESQFLWGPHTPVAFFRGPSGRAFLLSLPHHQDQNLGCCYWPERTGREGSRFRRETQTHILVPLSLFLGGRPCIFLTTTGIKPWPVHDRAVFCN